MEIVAAVILLVLVFDLGFVMGAAWASRPETPTGRHERA